VDKVFGRDSGAALAFEAVLILRHPADLVSVGHYLRRLEHGHVDLRLNCLQLIVDRMEEVEVIVLYQADRLDAARDRHLDAIEHHRPSREGNRLQPGRALPVDGGAAAVTGKPARIAPLRAMFVPVVPCCMAQPMTTSSTSAGWIPARLTASPMTWPARVAPSVLFSQPR
jgi:hypothetical protein